MPKNKGKGGKSRRRGKGDGGDKRELVFKDADQEYAQVLRMLGNGRCECMCIDGVKRLCHIRGKLKKRVWIANGDIVLVSLRSFQDEKADILLKYSAEEARSLKSLNELPDNIRINETDTVDTQDFGIQFADFEDSEVEESPTNAKPAARARPSKDASGPSLVSKLDAPTEVSGGIDLDSI